MPHSHVDEGWLATTNDTLTGDDDNATFTGGVRDILDSVVEQLAKEGKTNRTFALPKLKCLRNGMTSNLTSPRKRSRVLSKMEDLI